MLFSGGLRDAVAVLHEHLPFGVPWTASSGHWPGDPLGSRRVDAVRVTAEVVTALRDHMIVDTPATRAASDHLPVVADYDEGALARASEVYSQAAVSAMSEARRTGAAASTASAIRRATGTPRWRACHAGISGASGSSDQSSAQNNAPVTFAGWCADASRSSLVQPELVGPVSGALPVRMTLSLAFTL
ncbi:hypothetical protein AB0A74_05140 [Saccharothrix sp. NPDC042600]|uniref:hypothetical protein n=1 Tax=Saccharothrix TaxID=2071 RepID=UPI00340A6E78|nr:hypothetical protein GCM10017745_36790 [Saccharothrix mutabilis subsp. capreolus]